MTTYEVLSIIIQSNMLIIALLTYIKKKQE